MRIIGLPFTVHDAPMNVSRYPVEGYCQLLSYATGSSLSTHKKLSLDKLVTSRFCVLQLRFDRMRCRNMGS